MKRYNLTLGYLFVLFVFAFSCRPEGEVVRANLQNFTEEDQAKIGNQLTRHISDNPDVYDLYRKSQNQSLYSYLETVLATIVNTEQVINRDKFDWDIFVVRDDNNESAFTLPGGKIYITSGFLKFIQSEAQLLSILSHEMCYADHGLAMEKLQDHHSGLILGDILFNNPVNDKDALVGTLQNDQFDRAKVLRADLYSIDVLCPFQYEADGIFTVLNNVTDQNFPLEWLQTRPSYEARMDTISNRASLCGIATIEETRFTEFVLNQLD